jgi:tRNA modification GTPase
MIEALARMQADGKSVLYLLTKSDLPLQHGTHFPEGAPVISLSAETGEGMDALREAVEAAFIDGELRTGEEAVVFSARQHATLSMTAQCLDTAVDNLTVGMPYDICAEDVRGAMDALGALSGRSRQEDVIGEIFAKFCVGK